MKKNITTVVMMTIGIVVGARIGNQFSAIIGDYRWGLVGSGEFLINIGILLVAMASGYFLHIAVHEAGHLLAGLISGYSFVSYRFLSLVLVKDNDRLVRRKYNIVGTAGQCLMSPPDAVDGTFPVILYNLGGSIMNFLVCGACYTVYMILPGVHALVSLTLLMVARIGVILFLISFVPLSINGVANDGYNAFTLGRKEKARFAFWLMLRVNAMVTQGVRYSDHPAEWFGLIDSSDLSDPIMAGLAILKYSYMMDRNELREARALAESMLNAPGEMLELHQNELRCELLFHELIGECRKEEIEYLYNKKLSKYIKATSSYMSRQRMLYAYARLFLNDQAKADAAHRLFEKACSHSPFPGEIAGERALVGLIDSLAESRGTYNSWIY